MKSFVRTGTRPAFPIAALLFFFMLGLFPAPAIFCSENQKAPPVPHLKAFQPGEVLQYEVSWSKILRAGKAVMEVKEQTLPDGREVLVFTLTGKSSGLMGRLLRVRNRIESVFDPETMQSLSYSINESFGRKKRRRTIVFDHEQNTVINTLNNDPPQTLSVREGVQDSLASLYFLRTVDFTIGEVFLIDVHDSGKNWMVEVHTLGRESVRTPAGEFSAIKVKTRPLYEGKFLNKGEVYIWLTDDSRKVPVLMKSRIKIGSFALRLRNMKPGV